MSRIEELWEILKEYGIKTPEQFMEAYRRCPKIDITIAEYKKGTGKQKGKTYKIGGDKK